jgi:hypothetical protein
LTCPHCNKPGIRFWAKYWADPTDPAVCQHCNKASGISASVTTASTLLYVIAGIWAFMILALDAARIHNCSFVDCDESINATSPIALLISLLVFYVAVETAKVFWVPLKALSDTEVEKKKITTNRFWTAAVIIIVTLWLLDKYVF